MSVAPPLRVCLISVFVLLFSLFLNAQQPREFDRTLGGDDYEEQNAIVRLPDGFLLGGNSRSPSGSGEVSSTMFGNYDFWLVRTDFDLQPVWNRAFGGSGEDWLRALIQTSDGGFLAAGYSNSNKSGSKSQDSRGGYDFWLVKTDIFGQLEWEKTFGGPGDDEAYSILEAADHSGYFVGGFSSSDSGPDKTENGRGDLDFWLLKIAPDGSRIWDKTLGGPGREQFHSMVFSPDGQLVLSGGTSSPPFTGEVGPDAARGGIDFWLVKFSIDNQQVSWSHRYGGLAEDFAYSVFAAKNGGYFLGGNSQSPGVIGGSCTNCKRSENYGGRDFWLIKTDGDGLLQTEWNFGGTGLDVLYQVHENPFGQVLLAGVSDSPISGNKRAAAHGGYDFWLVYLDKMGHEKWQQSFGGSMNDALTKVLMNPDGSFLLAGHSESEAGPDKSEEPRGKNDFWTVKTFCDLAEQIEPTGLEKCTGQPAELDATIPGCMDCQYIWTQTAGPGGQMEPVLQILPPENDHFQIMAGDCNGCLAFDSILVDIGIAPVFDLGQDTVIFTGQTLEIGVENPDAMYHWNTGDTTSAITVSESGVYVLTVTEPSGCTARSWARVFVKNARAVYFPNIITPDFDGHNDYFIPYTDASVSTVLSLRVFDRWGTEYFERLNFPPNYPPDGWDGKFRGWRVNPDTYFWFSELLFEDGERAVFSGSVNVER